LRLNKLTTLHLHEFQAYMNKIEKLVPETVNKNIASLKTSFKFALETSIVQYNPLKLK